MLQLGQTGLQFDALVRFSAPLWFYYEMNPDDILAELETSDDLELWDTAVSLLESARLYWAYFRLPSAKQKPALAQLTLRMLGEEAEPDDVLEFDEMLETMSRHFQTFIGRKLEESESVSGYPILDFQKVLDTFESLPASPVTEEMMIEDGFGAENLLTPDAIALFAEPLLDAADLSDPDAFDVAFDKANDYWELAQLEGHAGYEIALKRIKRKYAQSPTDLAHIDVEARQMLDRYQTLFGKL